MCWGQFGCSMQVIDASCKWEIEGMDPEGMITARASCQLKIEGRVVLRD
jgi:hypothetical protein